MARKTGQIIGRTPRTWVVRVYVGRDAETRKRKYLNKTIHGGLRVARAGLALAAAMVGVCPGASLSPSGKSDAFGDRTKENDT
jgi:hypothetical protein